MKNSVLLMILLLVLSVSCNYIEDQLPEEDSNLVLKVGKVEDGKIYVGHNIAAVIAAMSVNSANPITEATWTIEDKTYQGTNITHRFLFVGEVPITVTAKFQNGTVETRTVTVNVVKDVVSTVDPVKVFSTQSSTSGRWTVTILTHKGRYDNTRSYGYSGNFNDSNPGVWLSNIKVPSNYYIIENNLPKLVSSGDGQYLGIVLDLQPRDYSIAPGEFEKTDGTGVFMWRDFSPSIFVKKENVGIIRFNLSNSGAITAQGDGNPSVSQNFPGLTGDDNGIFRGELMDGRFTVYFQLSDDFAKLKPFLIIKDQVTCGLGEPIPLQAVPSFPRYGRAEFLESAFLNKVTSLRFGNDIQTKVIDEVQMKKSQSYDPTTNEIRIGAYKISS